jgi:hypothetical protein
VSVRHHQEVPSQRRRDAERFPAKPDWSAGPLACHVPPPQKARANDHGNAAAPQCGDAKCRHTIQPGQFVVRVRTRCELPYIHANHQPAAEKIIFTEEMNWLPGNLPPKIYGIANRRARDLELWLARAGERHA